MRLRGRFVPGLVLIAFGVLIAACGGDSGEPLLKAANADEQLHEALLSPGDLPGSWVVAGDDDFMDAEDLAPDSVCDSLRTFLAEMPAESTARAQRRLELQSGPSVEIELAAFQTDDVAAATLADQRGLKNEVIASCFGETLKRQRLDSNVTVTPAGAGAAAPRGGIAYADERDLGLGGGTRVIAHAEIYTWAQGNVYIRVGIYSVKGVDVSDLVTTVLEGVSDSVDAALND